jgi:hypothetical protein
MNVIRRMLCLAVCLVISASLVPGSASAQVFNVDGHLYWWTPYYATTDSLLQLEYPEVPKGIDQACAEGESHFDTTALRYEPKYKQRYLKTIRSHAIAWCKKHHGVRSIETEVDQRCFSYNMHQNMGENLREDGYDEPTISTFTARVSICMFYRVFNRRLQKYKKKHGVHHVTREVFLDACADYNGGPGAIISRGHYRNWEYVKDKEERMTRIAGVHQW